MEPLPVQPRILVIRPGAMGDILVSTPLLANLKAAFPRGHIAFLVGSRFVPVLKANPYLDEVVVFDKNALGRLWTPGRMRNEMKFIAEVRDRRFDIVFDLLGNLRSAILSLWSGSRIRVGYNYRVRKFFYNRTVIARNPQYVVEFNLDSLRRVGIPIVSSGIHLPVDDADVSFAAGWLSEKGLDGEAPLIGLFPGGGWQSKRWPEEHFSKLGDMLVRHLGATVLIMGGPMEEHSVSRIASKMSSTPLRVRGLPLSRFAGLVSRLDLFVSNDSGPRYLAVAAGVPSIGLFGPTNGSNATPRDPKHVALTYHGECIGCNRLFCAEKDCMKGISPERVYEEAVRLLRSRELQQ
jgi:lipopolysaccharide heptosyltransferase II